MGKALSVLQKTGWKHYRKLSPLKALTRSCKNLRGVPFDLSSRDLSYCYRSGTLFVVILIIASIF